MLPLRDLAALSHFNLLDTFERRLLRYTDVYEQYLGHMSNGQGRVRAVLGARVEETGTTAETARPLLTSAARVHWYASCAPNADF